MSKIKFIRFRSWFENVPPMADVVYKSGRCVSLGEDELPKTARAFLKTAKTFCDYDKIFGFEIIYMEV